MSLSKLFNRIFWSNNTTPAINEDNLNAMSKAIDDIDDRVILLAGDVIEKAQSIIACSENPPYIGANGNWYTWDTDVNHYVDSEIDASITVSIADVTALEPNQSPYVTNTGTSTDPIFHLFIPRGAKGDPGTNGTNGTNGTDGVSPGVTISAITGGHRVTITDADHPSGQSFDVMDGTTMLNALTDVNLTSPSDGNALVYDSSTQKWVNGTVGGMATDGSNATSHVKFSGAFTVGSRNSGSTVGTNSTAEGEGNTASGNDSHAEGYQTSASGPSSHSEGQSARAAGYYAHAEGYNTLANTTAAHAEGHSTEARGAESHAEGFHTTAGYAYQHVGGKYNNNKTTTLFEIGNGTADNARSNAFEVYSDGSLSTDNGTTKTKLPVVKTATILANASPATATFTNMPSSGNHLVSFYTSMAGLDYNSISQSGNTVTLTYDTQTVDVTVYCSIVEVF